jgi:hypothetical protein
MTINSKEQNQSYVYIDLTLDKRIPFYVGKGNYGRIKGLERNYKHNKIMKEHGIVRFVIKCDSDKDAIEKEIFLIDQLRTFVYREDLSDREKEYATNYTLGGEGSSGHKDTQETKDKRNDKLRGKPRSPEVCRRIGEAHSGKILSKETRQKISDVQTGKPKEWERQITIKYDKQGNKLETFASAKIASQQSGISYSNLVQCCLGRRKYAGGYIWRYASKEHNFENFSFEEYDKKLYHTKGVVLFDLNDSILNRYKSLADGSRATGISTGDIAACCKGRKKCTGNYKWKYANDV